MDAITDEKTRLDTKVCWNLCSGIAMWFKEGKLVSAGIYLSASNTMRNNTHTFFKQISIDARELLEDTETPCFKRFNYSNSKEIYFLSVSPSYFVLDNL